MKCSLFLVGLLTIGCGYRIAVEPEVDASCASDAADLLQQSHAACLVLSTTLYAARDRCKVTYGRTVQDYEKLTGCNKPVTIRNIDDLYNKCIPYIMKSNCETIVYEKYLDPSCRNQIQAIH